MRPWHGAGAQEALSTLWLLESREDTCPRASKFPENYVENLGEKNIMAQRVKHLSAMQETRVRFLGWEDPLEKDQCSCLENPRDQGAW